jgi:phage FluMu protein gp41
MTVAAELVDAESLDEKLVMVEERENVDEAVPRRDRLRQLARDQRRLLVVKIPGTDPPRVLLRRRSTSGMTVAAELVDAESLDEKLVMVEERENVDELGNAQIGIDPPETAPSLGTDYWISRVRRVKADMRAQRSLDPRPA